MTADLEYRWDHRRAEAWKRIAQRYGVCSCQVDGPTDPFGCTDCLGTGFDRGIDLFGELKRAFALIEDLRMRLVRYEPVDDLFGLEYPGDLHQELPLDQP